MGIRLLQTCAQTRSLFCKTCGTQVEGETESTHFPDSSGFSFTHFPLRSDDAFSCAILCSLKFMVVRKHGLSTPRGCGYFNKRGISSIDFLAPFPPVLKQGIAWWRNHTTHFSFSPNERQSDKFRINTCHSRFPSQIFSPRSVPRQTWVAVFMFKYMRRTGKHANGQIYEVSPTINLPKFQKKPY